MFRMRTESEEKELGWNASKIFEGLENKRVDLRATYKIDSRWREAAVAAGNEAEKDCHWWGRLQSRSDRLVDLDHGPLSLLQIEKK